MSATLEARLRRLEVGSRQQMLLEPVDLSGLSNDELERLEAMMLRLVADFDERHDPIRFPAHEGIAELIAMEADRGEAFWRDMETLNAR